MSNIMQVHENFFISNIPYYCITSHKEALPVVEKSQKKHAVSKHHEHANCGKLADLLLNLL